MSDLDIQIVDSLTVDLNQVDYTTNAEAQNGIDVFIEDQQQFESKIEYQNQVILGTEDKCKEDVLHIALEVSKQINDIVDAYNCGQQKIDELLAIQLQTIIGGEE